MRGAHLLVIGAVVLTAVLLFAIARAEEEGGATRSGLAAAGLFLVFSTTWHDYDALAANCELFLLAPQSLAAWLLVRTLGRAPPLARPALSLTLSPRTGEGIGGESPPSPVCGRGSGRGQTLRDARLAERIGHRRARHDRSARRGVGAVQVSRRHVFGRVDRAPDLVCRAGTDVLVMRVARRRLPARRYPGAARDLPARLRARREPRRGSLLVPVQLLLRSGGAQRRGRAGSRAAQNGAGRRCGAGPLCAGGVGSGRDRGARVAGPSRAMARAPRARRRRAATLGDARLALARHLGDRRGGRRTLLRPLLPPDPRAALSARGAHLRRALGETRPVSSGAAGSVRPPRPALLRPGDRRPIRRRVPGRARAAVRTGRRAHRRAHRPG